jgi:hypothetical protein
VDASHSPDARRLAITASDGVAIALWHCSLGLWKMLRHAHWAPLALLARVIFGALPLNKVASVAGFVPPQTLCWARLQTSSDAAYFGIFSTSGMRQL